MEATSIADDDSDPPYSKARENLERNDLELGGDGRRAGS
jgi:hypothetical protein